jgi:hypothetical protein
MAQQQWWFYWDNAPVHPATTMKEWMAVKVLEHPPYSPDPALAHFFLFRRGKEALAGTILDQDSLKNALEGVTRTILPRTLPQPSGIGLSRPKSVFGLAATSSRNLEK